MVEEPVHGRRNAHASPRGRTAETLFEIVRIGRMQKKPDLAFLTRPPTLGRELPTEIPYAHPFEPETADVLRIECAFGAPVEDRIRMQKNAGRRQVVVAAPRLASGYSATTEAFPCPI